MDRYGRVEEQRLKIWGTIGICQMDNRKIKDGAEVAAVLNQERDRLVAQGYTDVTFEAIKCTTGYDGAITFKITGYRLETDEEHTARVTKERLELAAAKAKALAEIAAASTYLTEEEFIEAFSGKRTSDLFKNWKRKPA